MNRELTIIAHVLEWRGIPAHETVREVEAAVRKALENEGFDVGTLDVRVRELAP